MWYLKQVSGHQKLWFSDGQPISSVRLGNGTSYRLIVDQLGFLDLTEILLPMLHAIDANGDHLIIKSTPKFAGHIKDKTDAPITELCLEIDGAGHFTLTCINPDADVGPICSRPRVAGNLKPLPDVSAADAAFIDTMIQGGYVPYSNILDAPGKSKEEIMALGKQLFPFTPHSFQLAMCVYDWTTASFARLVFLKIFEYTGIRPPPYPIDQESIATQIWTSNWGSYNPQDADYMKSFMMKPATLLDEVKTQLKDVAAGLHKFSDVENRLLTAAIKALPRTSVIKHPQLFSGQMDIYQLGLSHFGIEFLECPLNDGPASRELITAFADTLATFVSTGKIITTKMIWSFTDNAQDAMHYSNGILLVAKIPGDSWVWEDISHITPLSDDPKKTEYIFMPGSQFEVESVSDAAVGGKKVVVITLRVSSRAKRSEALQAHGVETALPDVLEESMIRALISSDAPRAHLPHSEGVTGGRRCACATGN